jgi:hypothetical protein
VAGAVKKHLNPPLGDLGKQNTQYRVTTMELQPIQNVIYEIREQRIMLDFDLAKMYAVPTGRLNEAVKRNLKQYIEEVFTDYNDIHEDTLVQLEKINRTLAEMQVKNRLTAKPHHRIGFFTEEQRNNKEDIIE